MHWCAVLIISGYTDNIGTISLLDINYKSSRLRERGGERERAIRRVGFMRMSRLGEERERGREREGE